MRHPADKLKEQAQAQEKREKQALEDFLDRETVEADTRHVMGTKEGRRFVARILANNGLHPGMRTSSFTGNSTTFKLEGRREAALDIQADLVEVCPEQWLALQAENFIQQET